jgi:hypothetical protein
MNTLHLHSDGERIDAYLGHALVLHTNVSGAVWIWLKRPSNVERDLILNEVQNMIATFTKERR